MKDNLLSMTDRLDNIVSQTEQNLKESFDNYLEQVKKESKDFIIDCEEKKKETEKRYNSFFARWKWLDYLIIADLLIMPIIIAVIAYKVFIVLG